MSLAAYKPATELVKAGETTFAVRGVSSADLAHLMQSNVPELVNLISLVSDKKGDADLDEVLESQLSNLIFELPRLVTMIIALACDEDADLQTLLDSARKLPLDVQLDAIRKIAKLTFAQAGSLGKFMADVKALLPKKATEQ